MSKAIKPYEPPRLSVIGTFQELTAAATKPGRSNDGALTKSN